MSIQAASLAAPRASSLEMDNPSSATAGAKGPGPQADGHNEKWAHILRQLKDGKRGLTAPYTKHSPIPPDVNNFTNIFVYRRITHLTFDYSDAFNSGAAIGTVAQIISVFMMLCIVVSTIAFALESMPELRNKDGTEWQGWDFIEWTVTIFFTVEYVTRLSVSRSVSKFIIDPLNIVDILAIVPFYMSLAMSSGGNNLAVLRVLRVVRLSRLFKLLKKGPLAAYMKIFSEAVMKSLDALGILIFFVCICLLVFSSLIFYMEKGSCVYREAYVPDDIDEDKCWGKVMFPGVCDCDDSMCTGQINATCVLRRQLYISKQFIDGEEESPYRSIVSTFWWTMATITTVGYGDLSPVTEPGQVLAGIAMLCGIAMLALPISILGSNFQVVYDEHKVRMQRIANSLQFAKSEAGEKGVSKRVGGGKLSALVMPFSSNTALNKSMQNVSEKSDELRTAIETFKVQLESDQYKSLLPAQTMVMSCQSILALLPQVEALKDGTRLITENPPVNTLEKPTATRVAAPTTPSPGGSPTEAIEEETTEVTAATEASQPSFTELVALPVSPERERPHSASSNDPTPSASQYAAADEGAPASSSSHKANAPKSKHDTCLGPIR